jgi:HPt (histidine-containing phosphotransfer) domain-containing protein
MTGGTPVAPALDLAAALERLMGDEAMLERVLARFRTRYRDAAAAIGSALHAGDAERARLLVHSLKGAAGIIEAGNLHRQATALEQALLAAPDAAAGQLRLLEVELGTVMGAIDQRLG